MSISAIRIADISNGHDLLYRQFDFDLLISTIGIVAIGVVDINNVSTLSITTIGIVNLTNTNCRYRQLVLLRSCIIDIDNWTC